jgi:hypothetical protein
MADVFPGDIIPHVIKDLSTMYDTEVVVFENKAEQRFANDHTGQKSWIFEWKLLSPTNYALLQTFFDNQLGKFREWTITDTRMGGAQTCRFNADKLKVSPVKHKAFNISIEVVTCR